MRRRPPFAPGRCIFLLLAAALPAGCAIGPVGTLATRRTLTPTAEVLEIQGFGLWLRTSARDAGLSFGWRHVTMIYPRTPQGRATEAGGWQFGFAPTRREAPFHFTARALGAEVSRYPGFARAHLGYAMDSFTYAARANEARTVSFRYRPSAPAATQLAMHPPPSPALP